MGRVAMATPVGPRIVPVNYTLHGDAIVFRTAPYSELSTYGWNTELAFEVDHLDSRPTQGWSVVAVGGPTSSTTPTRCRASDVRGAPTRGPRERATSTSRWPGASSPACGSATPVSAVDDAGPRTG